MATKTTVIFGATSGIAFAYAQRRAAASDHLVLVGRSVEKLNKAQSALLECGATQVTTQICDFATLGDISPCVTRIAEAFPRIDTVLIAFGVLPVSADLKRQPTAFADAVGVNITAPAVVLEEVIAQFAHRSHHLKIGIISSVAGDRGRASNYHYGATKAGLSAFVQGRQHALALASRVRASPSPQSPSSQSQAPDAQSLQVTLTLIKPGLVATAMTAHIPKTTPRLVRALVWAQPQRIAADCDRAIQRGRYVLYTPWYWRYIMLLYQHLPRWLAHRTRQ